MRLSLNLPFSIAVKDDKEMNETKLKTIQDAFSPDYLRQPEFLLPNEAVPFPYRINDVPLLAVDGHVNETYWADSIPDSPLSPRGGDIERGGINVERKEKEDIPPAARMLMEKAVPIEMVMTEFNL